MTSIFTTVTNLVKVKYSPVPQDEENLLEQDSEREKLQAKAKKYGIKANLSTKILKSSIKLYEQGKAAEISPQYIKKGKEGNFLAQHKKAVGISGGTIFCIVLVLIIFFSTPST